MQSQVELMRINLKFEAPIIQVQIITYIIYKMCACVQHQLGGKEMCMPVSKLCVFTVVTQDKLM